MFRVADICRWGGERCGDNTVRSEWRFLLGMAVEVEGSMKRKEMGGE